MLDKDGQKSLVRSFSDFSRKAIADGRRVVIPHKFKFPSGDVITEDNFDSKKDLSKLNMDDWRLLAEMAGNGWDIEKGALTVGLDLERARRIGKKLRYFEFEALREKALVSILNPQFVAGKHMENVYQDTLTDNQRDSLKELAKITGAYKPSTSVNVQVHLEKPDWTPEQEAKIRAVFDTMAVEEVHAD